MTTYKNNESNITNVKRFLTEINGGLKEISMLTENFKDEPDVAMKEIVQLSKRYKCEFSSEDFKSVITRCLKYKAGVHSNDGYCDEVILKAIASMNKLFLDSIWAR